MSGHVFGLAIWPLNHFDTTTVGWLYKSFRSFRFAGFSLSFIRTFEMKRFYPVVMQADLVYAPSVVVISAMDRYQDTYKEVCQILRVHPLKKVGRSSFKANKLREAADEIARYWIDEENPCKLLINSICCL
jgi:hypothetical protein